MSDGSLKIIETLQDQIAKLQAENKELKRIYKLLEINNIQLINKIEYLEE